MNPVSDKHSRKKIRSLVVGGAGFLGSHLCEALIAQNQNVLCLDDLTTGSLENLRALHNSSHFSFIQADINEFDFSTFESVDYVFHAAGFDAYYKEVKPSLETLLTNSIGTKKLLDFVRLSKAKLLYISSADIYSGIASSLSLKFYYGQTSTDESRYSHHEAKRFGEALIEEYRERYGVNVRVVRLTDVYGPRMPLNSSDLLCQLFAKILGGSAPTLTQEGLQILHPTYISDVVYGIQRAALLDETDGGIYYLVSPQETTVFQVAEKLTQAAGITGTIEFQKSDDLLLPPAKIETEKTVEDLRWDAKVSLAEGINFTLDYYKKLPRSDSEITPNDQPNEETNAAKIEETQLNEALREDSPTPKTSFIARTLSALRAAKQKSRNNSTNSEDNSHIISKTEASTKITSPRQGGGIIHTLRLGVITLSVGVILIGLLGPLLLGGFFTYQGITYLRQAKQHISTLDYSPAKTSLLKARSAFDNAYENIDNLTWLTTILHLRTYSQSVLYGVSAAADLSDSINYMINGVEPIVGELKKSLVNDPTVTVDFLTISRVSEVDFSLSENKLDEARAKLDVINVTQFPQSVKTRLGEIQSQVEFVEQALDSGSMLARMLPQIMGQSEDRVYLFLFQNNMEQRATGGFIGSYARVGLSKGKVAEIRVDDIYNPDGQLTVSTMPVPEALKQYLSVQTLGMRDANWSPDFPTTAKAEIELYAQATGEKADGIIALDLYFVQNLIRALGPITLASKDSITADNLFEKAEYASEVNYVPGGTGKKDFLGELGFEIIETIKALPLSGLASIAGSFATSVTEKHSLLFFSEPALQEMVTERSWAGEALSSTGDYLWVIDSNVGGNKANYFIARNIKHNASVGRDGKITDTVEITYTHSGATDAWPGGIYKNYLRLYVPNGSVFRSSENFREAPASATDLGRTVFSGIVEVLPNSEKTVVVQYDLPSMLSITDSNLTYNLLIQKQSGSKGDSYAYDIDWPQYLTVTDPPRNVTVVPQKLSLATSLVNDLSLALSFSKR